MLRFQILVVTLLLASIWIATTEAFLLPPSSSPSNVVSTAPNHPIVRCYCTRMRTAAVEDDDDDNDDDHVADDSVSSNPEEITTLEDLEYQLSLIEALEERNTAQLDSFVDEQDQWDSLDAYDRQLLMSKDELMQKLEDLSSSDSV